MRCSMWLPCLGALAPLVACGGGAEPTAGPEVWVESVPGGWVKPHDDPGRGLDAIGYAGGYEEADGRGGVLVHDAARTQPGYNLYCSGDGPVARLMDGAGRVVHEWRVPNLPPNPGAGAGYDVFRRVHLLPDGELLAVWKGLGLVKLDRDSNILWRYRGRVHHDVAVEPGGKIWTLIREERRVPAVNRAEAVVDDVLVRLSAFGQEEARISVIDAFLASPMREVFLSATVKAGDFMHTNTVEVLDGRLAAAHPAFARGNLLVCLRDLDTAAVIDARRGVVRWMRPYVGRAPHEPVLTGAGTMLVFDNRGHDECSQVVEFDPLAPSDTPPVWVHRGSPPEAFQSFFCGTAARLANGNTLITESTRGRAFEVTPEGETVWAFENPARAGDRRQLIAAIYELLRVDAAEVEGWLER